MYLISADDRRSNSSLPPSIVGCTSYIYTISSLVFHLDESNEEASKEVGKEAGREAGREVGNGGWERWLVEVVGSGGWERWLVAVAGRGGW